MEASSPHAEQGITFGAGGGAAGGCGRDGRGEKSGSVRGMGSSMGVIL